MSSVIFIPTGVEDIKEVSGGVVKTIGNDETQELTVRQDNHQRTFIVKNDDGSIEVLNLVKRTTADLVLPDNRMALITFVDYHKHFEKIPLKEKGLEVIIGMGLSIKDSVEDIMNTIQSLQRDRSYRYIILDTDYNIVATQNKEIEVPKNATFNNIGTYLLSQVRQGEPDISNIEKGYITLMNLSDDNIAKWAKSSVRNVINLSKEDEKPLQILTQTKKEIDSPPPSSEETDSSPMTETTKQSPITPESPQDTAVPPQEPDDIPEGL